MPPPENWTAPESLNPEADVPPLDQAQDSTYVPRRPLSPAEILDRDYLVACSGSLRTVRNHCRLASHEARQRIADEAMATAMECQRLADQYHTRADYLREQLLIGLDDRRGRR